MRQLFLFRLQVLALVGIALSFAALPFLVHSAPSGVGPVLVVASPWSDLESTVTAAGGRIIGPQQALFGSLATSDDPEFEARLEASGVWIVSASPLVDLLCGGAQVD